MNVEFLLDELCTRLGFCLSPDKRAAIATNLSEDPEIFTYAVFEAEGLDPDDYGALRVQVSDIVQRHFRA